MHLHAPRSSRRLPLQRPRCRLACRATDSSSGTFADASLASKASKALVSGLTGIVNAVIPAGAQASEIPADTDRPSITPQDVLKGASRRASLSALRRRSVVGLPRQPSRKRPL